jgi:hypothetical protein
MVHQATRPNQVWSWDITWLPTTVRGSYLYLYLIMDVWSRRVVGWRIAEHESSDVAAALIRQSCTDGNVDPRGLVLHSDNGAAMRGNTMISTLQRLGVIPSFSRTHVSVDNPYSEALFRTLKQAPAYPRLPFADVASASRWVTRLVDWYNGTHRHSAIRYVTPDQRHHGRERGSRKAPKPVRTHAPCLSGALERRHAKLAVCRGRCAQPRTRTGATTILTRTALEREVSMPWKERSVMEERLRLSPSCSTASR